MSSGLRTIADLLHYVGDLPLPTCSTAARCLPVSVCLLPNYSPSWTATANSQGAAQCYRV
jgi:hypothetical protein